MRLSPCPFNLPLTDNGGQPIDSDVIIDLHRELLDKFGGFTIQPTSQGRWRSRMGTLYQEEIVTYEVAVVPDRIADLRELVCRLGRRLGQEAMYFDAPLPSVDIIDLSALPDPSEASGVSHHEPKQAKATRRRGKKDRPAG